MFQHYKIWANFPIWQFYVQSRFQKDFLNLFADLTYKKLLIMKNVMICPWKFGFVPRATPLKDLASQAACMLSSPSIPLGRSAVRILALQTTPGVLEIVRTDTGARGLRGMKGIRAFFLTNLHDTYNLQYNSTLILKACYDSWNVNYVKFL